MEQLKTDLPPGYMILHEPTLRASIVEAGADRAEVVAIIAATRAHGDARLLRILREENHRAGAKRGFQIASGPHPDESPEALIRQTIEYLARNHADLAAGYGLDHDGWDHEGDPDGSAWRDYQECGDLIQQFGWLLRALAGEEI